MKLAVFILIFNLFFPSMVFAGSEDNEPPAVFSHENVEIKPDQTVGRLMVADGNATINGTVKNGIIVIDGNVTIGTSARIEKFIFVLGGSLSTAEEVVSVPSLVVPPFFGSMADLALTGLLIGAFLMIILVPAFIWLFFYSVRDTAVYRWIKEMFLEIQHRWWLLYLLAGVLVSGLMLVLFLEIAWDTFFRAEMAALDSGIIWLVRYKASPELDKTMIFITNLGYGSMYLSIVAITFLLIAFYKRWREFVVLAVCLAGGTLLNFLLKTLFARSRPDLLRVVEAAGYSFPSGHAMVSLCFYGMLTYLIIRNIKSWRIRYAIIVLTSILVMAIGISRIYLGVHYPTDVMAGYAAGSMWLALCISLLIWWERNNLKRT